MLYGEVRLPSRKMPVFKTAEKNRKAPGTCESGVEERLLRTLRRRLPCVSVTGIGDRPTVRSADRWLEWLRKTSRAAWLKLQHNLMITVEVVFKRGINTKLLNIGCGEIWAGSQQR